MSEYNDRGALFCLADTVINCTIRGTMEYSGQKCSATARMYVPESLWPEVCADKYTCKPCLLIRSALWKSAREYVTVHML